jgi:hypothetical protein
MVEGIPNKLPEERQYESACALCSQPTGKTKTGLCRECLYKHKWIECQKCGKKCFITESRLCKVCGGREIRPTRPIVTIDPAPAVELVKDGIRICCAIQHNIWRSGKTYEIWLCCSLPDQHVGLHEQSRGGITYRWGPLCQARKHNCKCIFPARHSQPHRCATHNKAGEKRFGPLTWIDKPKKKPKKKRDPTKPKYKPPIKKKKRCNVLTFSGSFHCIRRRHHTGRHLYSFQGKKYTWSDKDPRIHQVKRTSHER